MRATSPTGLPGKIWAWVRRHPAVVITLLGVIVFTALFGAIWVRRFWAFQTFAWDLGIYNQALYDTTFTSHFFYYTVDLPAGNGGNLLAVHFSPLLITLVPFYALDPGPGTLLVLQALALALGAIPTFLIARRRLKSETLAGLFAVAYLASPLTYGTGWYDFHSEALIPVCVLFAFYFYISGRFKLFLVAWVVSLAVIETIAPFLIIFAVAGLVGALVARMRHKFTDKSWEELAVATLVAGIWFGATTLLLTSINPNGATAGPGYAQRFSLLGASGLYDVFLQAALQPGSAVAALGFQSGEKVLYIALVLGGFGFLPIFGEKRYLVPVAVWVAFAVLSNSHGYYKIGDQFTAYVLPFLVVGAIGGFARVRGWVRRLTPVPAAPRRDWSPGIPSLLLILAVIVSSVASPLLPTPVGNYTFISHGVPVVTAEEQALHKVIALIPPGASVLTTTDIFPEVSSRPNAFVFPQSAFFRWNTSLPQALGSYANQSDYVLFDYSLQELGRYLLPGFLNLTSYTLVAEDLGACLYAKHWSGPPLLFEPFVMTIAGGDLNALSGTVDLHDATPAGPALRSGSNTVAGGHMWSGPDLPTIPPGVYTATLYLRITSATHGALLKVAIGALPLEVAAQITNPTSQGHDYSYSTSSDPAGLVTVAGATINASGNAAVTVTNLTLQFTWTPNNYLETSGIFAVSGVHVILYTVTLTQTAI
ncbi:MAG: DUF2079 domain-containing protein [Thermoplasmata archaeon]|nr:DUF2079 domain-containing protein [Thermoplasmata archaeon]